jgi:hypothetical protein
MDLPESAEPTIPRRGNDKATATAAAAQKLVSGYAVSHPDRPAKRAARRPPFAKAGYSMIRKSGYRFSLATNARRCAEIMLKQKDRAG